MQRTVFRCSMCGREFDNRDLLAQHEKESHPQSRSMEEMGATQGTYSKEGTSDREGTYIGSANKESLGYRCSVCSTEFENQEKLDTHMKIHQYA